MNARNVSREDLNLGRGLNVDIHGHIIPAETLGKAGKYGPKVHIDDEGFINIVVGEVNHREYVGKKDLRSAGLGGVTSSFTEPEFRIKGMNKGGLDILGVTCSAHFYLYWAEPDIGIEFARVQNEALARYVSGHPTRLFFMPTLPLQDVKASVEEARYGIQELGGKALNIGASNIAGAELDDERFFPIYELAEELGVPLFVHPYPSNLARPDQDDTYHLSLILGFPYEETVAFTRLVFGGVLDVFPKLKVYITHGGGFTPYQLGRIATFAKLVPGVKAKRPIEEYLGNFYFDVLLHDSRARKFMVDVMGPRNVVVGSNYGGMDAGDGFKLLGEVPLTDEHRHLISGENAVTVFGLQDMAAARAAEIMGGGA